MSAVKRAEMHCIDRRVYDRSTTVLLLLWQFLSSVGVRRVYIAGREVGLPAVPTPRIIISTLIVYQTQIVPRVGSKLWMHLPPEQVHKGRTGVTLHSVLLHF
jgi:hypothetical protein